VDKREEATVTGADRDWLPEVARARMARFEATGLKTSLLSVNGAVGIESVGFGPVGEVMGCIVQSIGWTAGYNYGGGFNPYGSLSFQPYVAALYHGFDTALHRMAIEARAMGADGVVGVRLTRKALTENGQEFVALGTAVRARSTSRPKSLFTTELAGQDFAKLLQAGWVPARIAIGISVQSRFLDWNSQAQMSVMAGNVEVSGYTELVNRTRADARKQFVAHSRGANADGAIVAEMGLRSWHMDVNETPLLCAEATIFGTTIARFHQEHRAPTSALTIMPLRRPGE
jgi:uncharacterized protein YbjQ (UPF0145 family)